MDFEEALRTLVDGGVRFVIVGGAAATAHGSTQLTQDLDIVYDRAPENVDRLVGALAPLHPYLKGAPPGLPFGFDRDTVLAGLNFTLTTDLGDLDVLGETESGVDSPADGRPEGVGDRRGGDGPERLVETTHQLEACLP